jgi:hypothetical protein
MQGDFISDMPPLSPEGEVGAEDKEFEQLCFAAVPDIKERGLIVGATSLTLSERWGLVFRLDYFLPEIADGGPVNRVVCWRDNDGTVMTLFDGGDEVEPLPHL